MSISRSQQFLENLWYRNKPWWLWLFLPLHGLLYLLVWFRKQFYRWGLFSSTDLKVPVVIIGNINVGGTGKTPFAIYLLNMLKAQGYKPGLVTRGYGGDTDLHPLVVDESSEARFVGDEPLLIFRQTKATIIVDYNRARGANKLVDEYNCDLIICDDGLQHYALQRDLEVLIVDGVRGFGNGFLMPFGPLREPIRRANSCDICIVNGDTMQLRPQAVRRLNTESIVDSVELPLTAIAAIGNPQRFFDTLNSLGLQFETKIFPDHHQFSQHNFANIQGNIIMTEKDAVKCSFVDEERFYYLPVNAEVDTNIEKRLMTMIEQKIKDKTNES